MPAQRIQHPSVYEDLTVLQHQGAVLEAAGVSATNIARTLEVHTKTISKWRRNEDYKKAILQYRAQQAQQLAPMVHKIQTELARAIVKAIRTVDAAMDAETQKGEPHWSTRLRAATEALSAAKLVAPGTLEGGGEKEQEVPQTAVIRVELPEPELPRRITAEASVVEDDA